MRQMVNVRLPFNWVVISEVGQDGGKGAHTAHHSELIPGGMERVQERTGTLLCQDTTTAS